MECAENVRGLMNLPKHQVYANRLYGSRAFYCGFMQVGLRVRRKVLINRNEDVGISSVKRIRIYGFLMQTVLANLQS